MMYYRKAIGSQIYRLFIPILFVFLFQINSHANTQEGTLKWSVNLGAGAASSAAIGADGTIYVGSADRNLYAINPDGTQKWVFLTSDNYQPSPAIGADGTIYVRSSDGNFYAINPDGTQKWVLPLPPWPNSDSISPVIGADGTIYVISEDWNSMDLDLFAINPDGTQKWVFPIAWGSSTPAIGADGTIYVGSRGRIFYAINPDGTQKWVLPIAYGYLRSPAIGADGTIYVSGSAEDEGEPNILYAINSSSMGLANSAWPMFMHDVRHTGRFEVPPTDVIEIEMDIKPRVLNLKSKGKKIISFIKLPEEYDPKDIDKDSLELSIPSCPDCGVMFSNFEFPLPWCFIAFFPRQDLIDEIKTMDLDLPTKLDLKVNGELKDGTPFEGLDTIRVIKKWNKYTGSK